VTKAKKKVLIAKAHNTGLRSYKENLKLYLPFLQFCQGEVWTGMVARLVLTTTIIAAVSAGSPLAWDPRKKAVSNLTPIYNQVHNTTGVSAKKVQSLFESLQFDEESNSVDFEVKTRAGEAPPRLELRGCTPAHLTLIDKYIDACHSRAGPDLWRKHARIFGAVFTEVSPTSQVRRGGKST